MRHTVICSAYCYINTLSRNSLNDMASTMMHNKHGTARQDPAITANISEFSASVATSGSIPVVSEMYGKKDY